VKPELYFYSVLSYVSYSQIFLFIVFKAAFDMLKNKIQGNSLQWYKTERSKEKK
ncbi:glycosyltransferase family 2 protein, partial [Acinetobacter baumannii]|nr:glycosyltransferase family 2 protein [Acinetobacter baumannii]